MRLFLLLLLIEIALPSNAYAYLDPGTGSIILQALAASAIAAGIFWRRVITFVKYIFKIKD